MTESRNVGLTITRMTVKELAELLGLTVLCSEDNLGIEVAGGYAGDILSDALAVLRENMVWITVQSNANMVAVAAFRKAAAVILPKDVMPDEDTLAVARREGVAILGSDRPAFETAGMIYALLNGR